MGLAGGLLGRRPGWWTRNKTIRTLARLSLEEVLQDSVPLPAYQRFARCAAELRAQGRSDHLIAVDLGVTGKTVAKAVRWFQG